jgi:hypothetical protein
MSTCDEFALVNGGSTQQLSPTTIGYPDGTVGKAGGGSIPNCSAAWTMVL